MEYDNEVNLENAILYADSARSVYTPQFFAESIKRECVSGVADWQWDCLVQGPYDNDDDYWFAWDRLMDIATITDPDTGKRYTLWQDGDLWLVPIEEG